MALQRLNSRHLQAPELSRTAQQSSKEYSRRLYILDSYGAQVSLWQRCCAPDGILEGVARYEPLLRRGGGWLQETRRNRLVTAACRTR